jgi:MFS transporter, Spinster family, sphingosine-1-phosphate transporter
MPNESTKSERDAALPGAWSALALLLGINLFNYIDRQILAAVEPEIRSTFFSPNDINAMAKTGTLATAFLFVYMFSAPLLGWLADRMSRWLLIGVSVMLWSLASGASGLAMTFAMLFATRLFVGIGEGAYGPAAPTILSDLFSIKVRGRVLAYFCAAIPVGSALGYVLGGLIGSHLGWRWAFYLVTPPGLLLGAICLFMRDPRDRFPVRSNRERMNWKQVGDLLRTRSYVINTIAQTAMTFALGGLAFWIPGYLQYRHQPPSTRIIFGGITVVAGLISTILGGIAGDRLRKRVPGSYFLVSGIGMLLAFPFTVGMVFTPFPLAWVMLFFAVFFVFFNTGPSNTAIANVALPTVRATAFALNIFIIHFFGDAGAPPLIGFIAGHTNLDIAFLFISVTMLIAGVVWLAGMKYLARDTAVVEEATVSI